MRIGLEDVCMIPASSKTQKTPFVCFVLLIYYKISWPALLSLNSVMTQNPHVPVTKGLLPIPAQLVLQHLHVLRSILLHTGFCETEIQS